MHFGILENFTLNQVVFLKYLCVKVCWTLSYELFSQCPLLNISYCPPSEAILSNKKSLVRVFFPPYFTCFHVRDHDCLFKSIVFSLIVFFFVFFLQVIVVYNPLGWKREEVIRIPVSVCCWACKHLSKKRSNVGYWANVLSCKYFLSLEREKHQAERCTDLLTEYQGAINLSI